IHCGLAVVSAYDVEGGGFAMGSPGIDGFAQLIELARDQTIELSEVGALAGAAGDQQIEGIQLLGKRLNGAVVGLKVSLVAGEEIAALAGFGVGDAEQDLLRALEDLAA